MWLLWHLWCEWGTLSFPHPHSVTSQLIPVHLNSNKWSSSAGVAPNQGGPWSLRDIYVIFYTCGTLIHVYIYIHHLEFGHAFWIFQINMSKSRPRYIISIIIIHIVPSSIPIPRVVNTYLTTSNTYLPTGGESNLTVVPVMAGRMSCPCRCRMFAVVLSCVCVDKSKPLQYIKHLDVFFLCQLYNLFIYVFTLFVSNVFVALPSCGDLWVNVPPWLTF